MNINSTVNSREVALNYNEYHEILSLVGYYAA